MSKLTRCPDKGPEKKRSDEERRATEATGSITPTSSQQKKSGQKIRKRQNTLHLLFPRRLSQKLHTSTDTSTLMEEVIKQAPGCTPQSSKGKVKLSLTGKHFLSVRGKKTTDESRADSGGEAGGAHHLPSRKCFLLVTFSLTSHAFLASDINKKPVKRRLVLTFTCSSTTGI